MKHYGRAQSEKAGFTKEPPNLWPFTRYLSMLGIILLIPLFFIPVISVLSRAFLTETGNFSLENFRSLLVSPYVWRIVWFTIFQASLSTLLSLFIGLPGAYLLSQYRFRGRFLLRAVCSIPFVLPAIIVVLGFVVFYGNNGFINHLLKALFNLNKPPLQLLYSFKAIIIAHSFYNFPIVLTIVSGYWEQVTDNSELTAYTLGASRSKTFFSVTLPKLYPAILSVASLIFLFCFTSFVIILVLGGGPQFTTIEVEIYREARVSIDLQSGAGLALISLFFSSLILALHIRIQRSMKGGVIVQSTKAILTPAMAVRPGRAAKVLFSLYTVGALLFTLAPLAAIMVRSFQSQLTRSGGTVFTLKWYAQLFGLQAGPVLALAPQAFSNSFLLASGAIVLAVPAALGLSYLARDLLSRRGYFAELLFMLPLAVSSIILGLGYFILTQYTDNLVLKRLMLVAVHAILTMPFMLRALIPVFQHMGNSTTSAALLLGARPAKVFFSIELPYLKHAIISGAIFAAAISLGEVNATLMFAGESMITIPILLYRLIGSYNFYAACAVGTLLMLLCFILFAGFEYLREKL